MPTTNDMASMDVEQGSLLRFHKPFKGGSKMIFLRQLSSFSNYVFLRVTLGIFDDPIYRGPDAIESRTFFPGAVLFMAIYFEELEL